VLIPVVFPVVWIAASRGVSRAEKKKSFNGRLP